MSRLIRVVVAAVLAFGVVLPSTGGVVGANPQPAPRGVCTKVGQVVSAPVPLVCKQTAVRGLRWRKAPTPTTTTTTTTSTTVVPSTTVMVVPTVSLAATFLDSGTFPKAAVVTANVAGTVYFIEGASPVTTVSDITSARYYRWTSGVVAANTPTSIALDVDVLTNGYYRVFVANSQGVLSAPALNKVTISISRASNVVALSCAAGGTCAVGDTGPGGGVVFYVQAAGGTFACGATLESTCKYLEAARTDDLLDEWCSDISTALGTTRTVIGTGMANTTTADTTCTSLVIQNAADYTNSGKSDWYLPSKDELNSLYLEREIVGGFSNAYYWSSSEVTNTSVWTQRFDTGGSQTINTKDDLYEVRLVRAFGGTLACADGGICAVGDTGPGGGVVFYVQAAGGTFACGATLESTCKYLEAAPANWLTGTTDDPTRSWATHVNVPSNQVTAVIEARGTAIGSGYKNSLAVVAQTGNVAATSAAVLARAYEGNSKTDWYLPSKGELNELCKYARSQTTGNTSTICGDTGPIRTGFVENDYLTSSENNEDTAWYQSFQGRAPASDAKDGMYYVRPVRAFK